MYWNRRQQRVGIVLLATVLLGGCATTDCDPRNPSFIDGVYGELSGCYKKRIQIMEAALAMLKEQQQKFAVLQKKLKDKNEDLQTQIDALSNDTSLTAAEIASKQANIDSDLQKADDLAKDVDKVQAKTTQLMQQKTKTIEQAEKFKKQAEKLKKEVDDLWTIYHSLQ